MRRGFDSLSGLVTSQLRREVLDRSAVFIFVNRKRTHIKLLHWEGDGFALYYKRLEKGTFELPVTAGDATGQAISYQELQLVLQGIALKSVRRRKRYQHPA